ncbi:hypothetical protein H4N54_18090 [Limnospira fusiformis KN01]|uniref:Uncharacterized protein n=1 Tax=Limnospira maxima CS-328 TaxID=513049 RepID=B5W480_LIMMA|nr:MULTISPECIES: hypothetical protein [Limnospira]MDC0840076.1 hypothetical protein [Limnoraphis robusta]MDY7051238.1 hypothetical protein [Limnospira fusiformis LS22]QJB24427.1 hypothetical protein HFV01_21965 [Limnospira fusiformis SAG 85.79]EDZ93655.1 hypothetical protein AmaxDRAFT_3587 [Limnospira maxima CS-328]ULB44333.1 hypothetical protein H4N54_18090 [Limnospira fusiformis KN01]
MLLNSSKSASTAIAPGEMAIAPREAMGGHSNRVEAVAISPLGIASLTDPDGKPSSTGDRPNPTTPTRPTRCDRGSIFGRGQHWQAQGSLPAFQERDRAMLNLPESGDNG